jgi:hypothetical protein
MYSRNELIEKLNYLKTKYKIPLGSYIDKEVNFPTRKVFIREFGSIENAFKEVGILTYKKGKFYISDAQNVLNNRNPNFILLCFSSMRNKNLTQCKTCGYQWSVSTDSLLRNNTTSHGCPNCSLKEFYNKLEQNDLQLIESASNNRKKVMCKKCKTIFTIYASNATSKNFNCQYCSQVDKKKYKLSILNRNYLQSYYILGFLFSDGSFHENRLRFYLRKKDSYIVYEIAHYLGITELITINKNSIGFSCMDTSSISVLVNRYNIKNNKTYTPCDLTPMLNSDNFTAFIIGFIDGDGYLGYRSDTHVPKYVIKLHKNWKNNLNLMSAHLYNSIGLLHYPISINVRQKNEIYASLTIGNQMVIKYLNNFILKNNLFVLDRKWLLNKGGGFNNE